MNKKLFLRYVGYLLVCIPNVFMFGYVLKQLEIKEALLALIFVGVFAFVIGLGFSLIYFSEEGE